jgi:hypothetical protein
MRGRGGQVSIFIILGIAILILFVFLNYIQTKVQVDDKPVDTAMNLPQSPIYHYTQLCLEKTAKDAIVLIGMQGGYVELPKMYDNKKSYIQDLDGGVKVPLWRYQGQNVIPSKERMEAEIASYVNQNLDRCLRLETLNEVENYKRIGNITTIAKIGDTEVSVFSNLTIEAQIEGKKVQYKEFYANVPVNLGKILSTASYVLQRHTNDPFLERATINVLSMDPDIPLGGMEFSCQKLSWSKREVQAKIQDYLTSLFPRVRIVNTGYIPFKEPLTVYSTYQKTWSLDRVEVEGKPDNLPNDMYEYLHLQWDMGTYDWGNIVPLVSYFPKYGMRMQVNPSDGDKIKSNPGKSDYESLKMLCVNIYHFTYDFDFPVKLSLYDSSAFNGEGYVFSYAIPVTIDHNYPTRDSVGFLMMDATDTDTQFCNTTYDNDIYVVARDYFTGMPVGNVNVTFDCVKYYCDYGQTNMNDSFGVPQLKVKLPLGCANGYFIGENNDYIRFKEQVVAPEEKGSVELTMVPLKKISYSVAQLNDAPWMDGYSATVYLSSKDENIPYEAYGNYPVPAGGQSVIQLIDGPAIYDLNVILMKNGGVVGGWTGNFTVRAEDLSANKIIFHAFEKLPNPVTSVEKMNLYQYLDEDPIEDPYRVLYQPEFQ